MAAHKGNKYHEVWTEEKAMKLFTDSLEMLKGNQEIMYIGTLANENGLYRHIYEYLEGKFREKNQEISTIKKLIDSILESRLFDAGLKNKVNPTMAIFGLKNNYNWKDKTEVEVDQKQNIIFKNLSNKFDIDENGNSIEK